MKTTLLSDGAFLMLIGMGTVFVFLTILMVAMNISKKVLNFIGKYFPEEVPQNNIPKQTNKKDEEIAIAIAWALRDRKKV